MIDHASQYQKASFALGLGEFDRLEREISKSRIYEKRIEIHFNKILTDYQNGSSLPLRVCSRWGIALLTRNAKVVTTVVAHRS